MATVHYTYMSGSRGHDKRTTKRKKGRVANIPTISFQDREAEEPERPDPVVTVVEWRVGEYYAAIALLTAEGVTGTSDSGSLVTTSYVGNRQQSLEHSANTFAGEETSCDGVHVHVEILRVSLQPEVVQSRTSSHGNGVVGLGNDERKSESVEVGHPNPVFLRNDGVFESDSEDGKERHSNGGITRSRGDRKFGGSYSLSYGNPSRDGRGTVRALTIIGRVQDAGRGRREEDEESNIQEDGDHSTRKLGEELHAGFGPKEVTGLQIPSHVASLASGTTSDGTTDQIEGLSGSKGSSGETLSDTTENKLRSFCDD